MAVSGVVGYALADRIDVLLFRLSPACSARRIRAVIRYLRPSRCSRLGLGAKFGNAMAALASMAMWFCGLSCMTSASRAVYSLARDNGMPCRRSSARVHPKHGTPGPAIWAIVAASLAAMAWSGAVPIVTSLSTVALYLAYIVPGVWFSARCRVPSAGQLRRLESGTLGRPVNVVAIVVYRFISSCS